MLKPGDRVVVIGDHPWAMHAGVLVGWEQYGLGGSLLSWWGWRVELDGCNGECYAEVDQLLTESQIPLRSKAKAKRKIPGR
jgi:hypothetical protein